MVWPPSFSGDYSGSWAGYSCRLMLELTALGKWQPCFAPGSTSHPCSIVWGLSVSDPVEEQADWEGWSSRKAGSWLQDSLPSVLLPALGCCAAVSVSVVTHPCGLVAGFSCSIFASSYSCYYFLLVPDADPAWSGSTPWHKGRRWRPAGTRERKHERVGCDNWHCHLPTEHLILLILGR